MLLLLVTFTPIVAAILIMSGLPARLTAMAASVLTLLISAIIFLRFNALSGFQFVVTFPISPELQLDFAMGIDGLSLLMILLGAIVLFAAVCVTGEIEHHENAFYACLLFIAGGAIGAGAGVAGTTVGAGAVGVIGGAFMIGGVAG